ncbi:MAG TPA: lipopolysaccharide biosynthesis protein [Anaerolineales bacterium]|nr:lipopolysaccharide biosynthesis protein [Anaerolineales bacterium]
MGSGVTGIPDSARGPDPSSVSPRAGRQGLWRRATRLLFGDIARQGYLSGLDQALISLTNFATSIMLARALSPTQFGAYGVGFILLRLARAFQEGLVVQPMTSLTPSLEVDGRRGYLSASAGLQLGLASAEALACASLGWILIRLGNDVAGPTLFAMWCPLLLAQPQEFVRRVFYTLDQVSLAVLNTLVSSVVQLVLLAWLLAAGAESGTVGLYAIGWSSGAALLLALIQSRHIWIRRGVDLLATWRKNWRFGRWLLGGTAASWTAVEVYPVLTAGLVSFAATGAYRALQNVVAPIHSLLRAMDTYFTPRLADRRHIAGAAGVVHMVRQMFLVTGPPVALVLVVAVAFAEPILRLLYGETYIAYASGMRLMAIFYALWYSFWPIQSALKALEKTRPIFFAGIAALIAMATVGVWAILRWGVYGTIVGQALSALILSLVLWATWLRWVQASRRETSSARASPSS